MTAVSDPPYVEFDLASLVREHQADVWRYLCYLGAAADDADDLTQETFLSVARTPFELRTRGETSAYLRTAARNHLLILRRKQGRLVGVVDMAAAEDVWAEMHPDGDGGALVEHLRQCCKSLTGRAQDAVNNFYRDGLTREATAAAMGLTVDGVKTLLRRTRETLRQCVERRRRSEDASENGT